MAHLNVGAPRRVHLPVDLKVELTEDEGRLCNLLDECTQYLKAEKDVSTSCRIAGGWVRDKLLGSQSNDIDIALVGMMGYPFAEHLAAFAKSCGIETGSISKIAQNPDQSKHLETATLKILGLELDLVNLRSEEYTTTSRIPTGMTFGTPLQDALRRDITINALFYNVHSRSVEDFTERGLDDIRQGTIRTPLPPQQTFLDDPLRALRCIRFASRFGFETVPEVGECLKKTEIHNALVSKVSRERVGEEVSKMMKGHSPLHAMQLINEFDLYDSIFSAIPLEIKNTFSRTPEKVMLSLQCTAVLQALIDHSMSSPLLPLHQALLAVVNNDATCKSRLYLACAIAPYIGITYEDKKKKTYPAAFSVIRDSLKLGTQNHYSDGVPALFAASDLLKSPSLDDERFKTKPERVAIGMLLRQKSIHNPSTGSHWSSSILFSLVRELGPLYDASSDMISEEADKIIRVYNEFAARIEELDLLGVADARTILNGRDVGEILEAKPGPWMGQVLTQVMEWQLEHPERTKEDCATWLKHAHSMGLLQTDFSEEPIRKKARTA
ncbi:transfer RNA nucleotidyltransferase [Guyanagaster necrorhizus]|uniref:Transfer RNA nucleotidyltransferase n=1 Tax=Guyanagaster necrorhizus TaxID=856835 RepID=A0A9P7W0V7_9AGAR|nr:transfer RNA nucleotidyltransferase [Guyanagaster necrorhizus MCA 3950]KAG7450132.1 transfer RNA nucleotidyltransferase [Guyanagaster necrorhizus MCA 3950]